MCYRLISILVTLLICSYIPINAADMLDTLIRERVMTSPPDRPKAQVYDNGVVMIGDLFKSRARIAIAVSTQQQNILAMACFVHRAGDWQEINRQTFTNDAMPHRYSDEWPITFTDLDGDSAPELLLTESGGGDDRIVSVWRYNAEQQAITKVGSGLRNPQWLDGAVRGTWKLGYTRGDVGAEEHAWIDGRLVRKWSSEQRYSLHEYVIGSGEPAVRVEQVIRNDNDMSSEATIVGNLASFRNHLPQGEQPRPMKILIQEKRGRTVVHMTPNDAALGSENLAQRWDDVISRAVLTDPSAFSATMSVAMPDGKKVALQNVATVSVTPSTVSPTYQYFPIDDALRKTFSEPADMPALAVANLGSMNWTRIDQAVAGWAAASAVPAPTVQANDDVVFFIRLPNFSGYPLDQIEIGTLVTSLVVNDNNVQVNVSVTPGTRPSLATKDVARPLLLLNLGRLSPGSYKLAATVSGLPEPHPGQVNTAFTVK